MKYLFYIIFLFNIFFSNFLLGQYLNIEHDIINPIKSKAAYFFSNNAITITPESALHILNNKHGDLIDVPFLVSKSKKKINTKENYKKNIKSLGFIAICTQQNPLRNITVNQASTFFISDNGICITNYHVLFSFANSISSNGKSILLVRTFTGEIYQLKKILGFSAKDDIAILQIELPLGKTVSSLNFAKSDGEIGDDVVIIGNTTKQPFSITSGILSGRYNDLILSIDGKNNFNRNLISVTAPFGVGASGSPIFNHSGNLIGMVSSTYVIEQNNIGHPQSQFVIKNGIPLSSIIKVLRSNKIIF